MFTEGYYQYHAMFRQAKECNMEQIYGYQLIPKDQEKYVFVTHSLLVHAADSDCAEAEYLVNLVQQQRYFIFIRYPLIRK